MFYYIYCKHAVYPIAISPEILISYCRRNIIYSSHHYDFLLKRYSCRVSGFESTNYYIMQPVVCPVNRVALKINYPDSKYWVFHFCIKNCIKFYLDFISILTEIYWFSTFIKQPHILNLSIPGSKPVNYIIICTKICQSKPVNIFSCYYFLVVFNNSLEYFFSFFLLLFMGSFLFQCFQQKSGKHLRLQLARLSAPLFRFLKILPCCRDPGLCQDRGRQLLWSYPCFMKS